jgi:conjugal transfer/type IV secretion protein DotA/TraY
MGGLNITRGQFLRYTLTPQLGGRVAALFGRGFAHIPYFIALLYQAVGLLPPGHPYGRPAALGRFGVRDVVGQAWRHLRPSWANIDQVVVFGVVLAGIVLVAAQVLILPVMLALSAVPAQAFGFGDLMTPDPRNDLAHMMMDLTFGVPGIFNSCISTGFMCVDANGNAVLTGLGATTFPHPIHYGLHYILNWYSTGLMIVAVFLVCYFVSAMVIETAQTGTPMGKRTTQAWVVLRLVVAIGLLWPGGYGLNTAQYITLYAAKYGSGLASNGWIAFINTLDAAHLGQTQALVAKPNIPEIATVLQFFHVAATCKEAYALKPHNVKNIKPYLVRGIMNEPPAMEVTAGTTYEQMLTFIDGGDVAYVRFGVYDKDENPMRKGWTDPRCGELAFELSDNRKKTGSNPADPGPYKMQEAYWNMLRDMWFAQSAAPNYPKQTAMKWQQSTLDQYDGSTPELPQSRQRELYITYSAQARAAVDDAASLANAQNVVISPEFKAKGWAFAGVLYHHIAEKGGNLAAAVYGLFAPSQYPALMQKVCARRTALDRSTPMNAECSNPRANSQAELDLTPSEMELITPMYIAARDWEVGVGAGMDRHHSSNEIMEFIHMLFGTEGLYNMRDNTDVHPLAQLTMVGRSLVESAIRNIGYALFVGVGGGVLGGLLSSFGGAAVSGAAGGISSLLFTFATVAISIGFLLAYIVPVLPFIYFFFAVGGWIKGIFEAMVGVPLWALAHIRIDKEGLAGDAAKSGYFLILEIFIRPILILFGLMAGMITFSAMVMMLNETMDLLVANLTGFSGDTDVPDPKLGDIEWYRGAVDSFFFTVVYAIVVYMMAMSSFKLIDLIPNNILRWMGASVKTFSDEEENPAEGMMRTAQIGSQQAFSQTIGQGLGGAVKAITG